MRISSILFILASLLLAGVLLAQIPNTHNVIGTAREVANPHSGSYGKVLKYNPTTQQWTAQLDSLSSGGADSLNLWMIRAKGDTLYFATKASVAKMYLTSGGVNFVSDPLAGAVAAWIDSGNIAAGGIATSNVAALTARLAEKLGISNVGDSLRVNPSVEDSTGSGIKLLMQYGGARAERGDLMRVHSDGKLYRADADSAITMPGVFLALQAGATNAYIQVLQTGVFRYDSRYNFTVGGIVYASTSTGELTTTAPSGSGDQVQPVGVALSADIINFRPDLTLVEVP